MATQTKELQKVHRHLKKKAKRKCEEYLEGYAGMVTVGDKHQPLCIPANSSKNVMG